VLDWYDRLRALIVLAREEKKKFYIYRIEIGFYKIGFYLLLQNLQGTGILYQRKYSFSRFLLEQTQLNKQINK